MMKLWVPFFWGGGHRKTGLIFGVISKRSMAFSLRSRSRNGIFLGFGNFPLF